MSREKAIKGHIQKAMDMLYDPIHPMPKAEIMRELSEAKRLLESEGKSEPPAGEFTKKFRDRIKNHCPNFVIGELLDLAIEACDRIDRLEAELSAGKESYDKLHIDYVERGREIIRLEEDAVIANEALREFARQNQKLHDENKVLKAEKFCKKCGCKMSLWCEKDVKERMDAKNSELQAENEKLTDAIESLNVDLSAAQELINKLTEYAASKLPAEELIPLIKQALKGEK